MASKPKLADPNGPHARLYWSILDSPAWCALSNSAKVLFVDLRRNLLATNNGNLSAALSVLKQRGWKHPGTLAKSLYELRTLGFLVQTRSGGVLIGSRVCALYAFTDQDVYEHPKLHIEFRKASHDYKQYKTLRQAKAALRDGVQKFRDKAISRRNEAIERKQKVVERKKTTLRNSHLTDPKIVAMDAVDRSKKRSREGRTDSKIVADKTASKTPETRLQPGFSTDLKGSAR